MNSEHSLFEQTKAVLFGVAVADALGVPVEFESREYLQSNPVTKMLEYGTYHQPKGTWSDDSSMTFCLAESLSKGYDLDDIARTSFKWMNEAYWTPYEEVFDIGRGTLQALMKLDKGISPRDSGGQAETDNGNGSLMRILPLVFEVKNTSLDDTFTKVCDVGGFTHGHIRSHLACLYYIEFARFLLDGKDKFEIYQQLKNPIQAFIHHIGATKELTHFSRLLSDDIWKFSSDDIYSSGYVMHTLEASIWCLLTTNNYKEAVLKAVNLGEDTDTTAAVTGGLAALLYGFNEIPKEWIEQLAKKDKIEELSNQLAKRYLRE
ncbi:ADP-ribosylglycohydrolase family protein [Pasteurellaceae bacterium 22721_9_1]